MSGWASRLWRRRDQGVPSGAPIDPTGPPALADGWNGLPWGSSVAEFRRRFPHADKTGSGWWVTGNGPEQFLGVTMAYTQYGYNSREQLFLVSFIPEPQHRAMLTPAALDTFGAPPGYSTTWRLGDVVVEVKTAGVVVTLTHERYARHT
jgi:hypothetical protein